MNGNPGPTSLPFNAAQRVIFGGLGGLVTLLVSAAAIDAAVVFSHLTFVVFFAYAFKTVISFSIGGMVGFFFGADDTKAVGVFIKGIAAPALLATYLNGHQVNVQQNAKMLYKSDFVATAYADDVRPTEKNVANVPVVVKCDDLNIPVHEFKRKEEGLAEQLSRAVLNTQKDDLYLVIGVFDNEDALCKKVMSLKENPERLNNWKWTQVYGRIDNSDPDKPHIHFYLALSSHLNQEDAKELLDKAIASGFAGAQIYNPWQPLDGAK